MLLKCSLKNRLIKIDNSFLILSFWRLKSMTKSNLITAIARATDVTKKDCDKIITSLLDTIVDALAKGDKVQLVGFGTFEVRIRKERQGRNPSNGEPITIPESKVPAFKAGKALKDAVSN